MSKYVLPCLILLATVAGCSADQPDPAPQTKSKTAGDRPVPTDGKVAPSKSAAELTKDEVVRAEAAVGETPDDPDALWQQALARYHAGDEAGATADAKSGAEKKKADPRFKYFPLLVRAGTVREKNAAPDRSAETELAKLDPRYKLLLMLTDLASDGDATAMASLRQWRRDARLLSRGAVLPNDPFDKSIDDASARVALMEVLAAPHTTAEEGDRIWKYLERAGAKAVPVLEGFIGIAETATEVATIHRDVQLNILNPNAFTPRQ